MTALVVLPGLDGTTELLSEFSTAASSHFSRVILVSYPTQSLLGYESLGGIVRASLPTDEQFVLLGESFSGPIAISIAADRPAGLVGLVLSTTFARAPVAGLGLFGPLVSIAPVRAAPLQVLGWWLLGRWATPSLLCRLKEALRSVASPVLRLRAAETLRVDVTSRLSQINVPVLYLRATADRLLARSAVAQVLSGIPHVRRADLEGPHLLLQAAPQAAAELIAKFVSSLD